MGHVDRVSYIAYHHPMNGLEMKGPNYGCDVYGGAGNSRVESIQREGDTCEVILLDGTNAVLCSEGHEKGFYIQSPLRLPPGVERYYPFARHNNSFLRLASGGYARAT